MPSSKVKPELLALLWWWSARWRSGCGAMKHCELRESSAETLKRGIEAGLLLSPDRSDVQRFLNSHSTPNGQYLKLGPGDQILI